tara:strand:+ start:53 stop:424 length:372 start_codon:yes stop_codon:yes gene_type:complete
MTIITKQIADIRKNLNVKEQFSVIQGNENKTMFSSSGILVTNNDIDNRLNTLNFEDVLNQLQFDFDVYSKEKNDDVCFSLFSIISHCLSRLKRNKLNEAKQELINYAICMIQEQDLQDKERLA